MSLEEKYQCQRMRRLFIFSRTFFFFGEKRGNLLAQVLNSQQFIPLSTPFLLTIEKNEALDWTAEGGLLDYQKGICQKWRSPPFKWENSPLRTHHTLEKRRHNNWLRFSPPRDFFAQVPTKKFYKIQKYFSSKKLLPICVFRQVFIAQFKLCW